MGILLINIPFVSPSNPYISIPTLVAFLKGKGIAVEAFDANIDFYHYCLRKDNVSDGKKYAHERIKELNAKQALQFDEMIEYSSLVSALNRASQCAVNPEDILDIFESGGDCGKDLFYSALSMAVSRHFPERLFSNSDNIVVYNSPFDEFNSSEVIKSIDSAGIISEYLNKVISPLIRRKRPEIVGISVYFQNQFLNAFRFADAVKKVDKDIHVTLGGPFISCFMRNVTKREIFNTIDTLCLDAGEIPLMRLYEEIKSHVPNLAKVPGMVYLSNGVIKKNDPPVLLDLHELPAPDYNAFDLDRYFNKKQNMWLSTRLSRGCYWARCTFCRSKLSLVCDYQQPEEDYLYDQIINICESTGVRNLHFSDDAADPRILEALSKKMISERSQIRWFTHIRIDPLFNLERLSLYRAAGCMSLAAGLESYNNRILRLMQKGTTTSLVDNVLSNIKWAGLNTSVYMITGFPTETLEEAESSFKRIKEFLTDGTIDNYIFHLYHITYGSPVYFSPEQYGIINIDRQPERDLDPDIFEFEAAGGMPRPAAVAASIRFNKDRTSDKQATDQIDSVTLNGQPLRLNFDMTEIQRTVFDGTNAALPYALLLKRLSEPLKPK
ncbi:B12-binding domain-containing radical SAM protein [Candidatus Magnetominusculus xianensis]|uniref:B12-binding domain-containing radical SAM protein n=1 Tax=Candidatus Magnetominusculus xianensis TaxID=1748249 RepID=A0ABR5SCZ5_9BACT|nr:radical SAM protein [Candidatus Magnetominusculus xianensis]KWT78325.1 B12-binding domain-containing radical SAM protein [Candidatus Magnetominusculus xianensis]MBF0402863.1 radical SAM protein [Nitrospirota bacterium]